MSDCIIIHVYKLRTRTFRGIFDFYSGVINVLRARRIDAYITCDDDEMHDLVLKKCQNNYVLLVTHGFEKQFYDSLPKNVFVYPGMEPFYKIEQYNLFDKYGISIAPWLVDPKSWEEAFGILGDKIIIKPNEGFECNGVLYITPNIVQSLNFEKHKHKIFCKYIGPSYPPFWKSRVSVLFGKVFMSYCLLSNDTRMLRLKKSMETSYVDSKIELLALQAAKTIENKLRCSAIGVDIGGHNNEYYVLETNQRFITLLPSQCDKTTDTKIAKACIKKLEELKP